MRHFSIATFSLLIFGLATFQGMAQTETDYPFIRELTLKVDTFQYSSLNDLIDYRGQKHLAFRYDNEDEVCEINLSLLDMQEVDSLAFLPSSDYETLDSLTNFNDEFYRMKLKFKDLSNSRFLKFSFFLRTKEGRQFIKSLRLFPYTKTEVNFYPSHSELFIGEEKTFELFTNNLENIYVDVNRQSSGKLDYRLSRQGEQLRLHILPQALGTASLNLVLKTRQPFLSENGKAVYELPPITHTFEVKESRLAFLNADQQDITLNQGARKNGVEIQLESHPNLQLKKTYRIEAQEQPGGRLIGEVFTRTQLSNGRVLCWLRLYEYHQISDGYLYLKDGDNAQFITNFAVSPETKVTGVSIMRDGKDWSKNLTIYPGEIIDVKIEGEALDKSKLKFDGLFRIMSDSALSNNQQRIMTLKIPITVYKKRIDLYNHGKKTTFTLNVEEYQRPKEFDFIKISDGERPPRPISEVNSAILWEKNINDVVLSFDRGNIDDGELLYGKQYISVDIRITGPRRQLIEIRTVEDIVVCPSESSVRNRYYDQGDCLKGTFDLNDYIGTKTYDLQPWSRIELTVKHRKGKHDGNGFTQKMDIYYARPSTFDIDVSFPAGLLIRRLNEEEFGGFGGISLAAIAQFTFYRPGSIAKQRPYRLGAGILALDAFNFSDNGGEDRDLAVVAIGSVYPLQRADRKLSFPLHAGFGYFITDKVFFFLLGPGIRVRL